MLSSCVEVGGGEGKLGWGWRRNVTKKDPLSLPVLASLPILPKRQRQDRINHFILAFQKMNKTDMNI